MIVNIISNNVYNVLYNLLMIIFYLTMVKMVSLDRIPFIIIWVRLLNFGTFLLNFRSVFYTIRYRIQIKYYKVERHLNQIYKYKSDPKISFKMQCCGYLRSNDINLLIEDICRTVLDIRQFAIHKFLQFMKILEYWYILQFLTFKS